MFDQNIFEVIIWQNLYDRQSLTGLIGEKACRKVKFMFRDKTFNQNF